MKKSRIVLLVAFIIVGVCAIISVFVMGAHYVIKYQETRRLISQSVIIGASEERAVTLLRTKDILVGVRYDPTRLQKYWLSDVEVLTPLQWSIARMSLTLANAVGMRIGDNSLYAYVCLISNASGEVTAIE